MTNKKTNYDKNIVYNIRLEGNLTKNGIEFKQYISKTVCKTR